MSSFKKIKLPRKRKKAFLKRKTKADYLGTRILNELLGKSDFPKYKFMNHGDPVKVGKW